jgi:hypothetical protein
LTPLLGTAMPPASPAESRAASSTTPRWWPVVGIGGVVLIVLIVIIYIALTSPSKTGKEPLVTATPRNTPVATVIPTAPPPLQTTPVADMFIQPTTAWGNSSTVYRRSGDLWLDNTKGASPLKATRKGYTTGKSGFTLSAVVRLAKGPSTAGYGILAANQLGPSGGYVALLVRDTGAWALRRTVAGHTSMLIGWHQSAAIRLGHNTVNELQLSLVPGHAQKFGTFSVSINGQPTFVTAQAWSAVPIGGVGILADPGAEVVCDGLSVNPSPGGKRIVDDYFLDNGLGWTGGTAPLVANDVMVLRPAKNAVWADARIPQYAVLTGAKPFSQEMMFALSDKTSVAPMGGLVFARATTTTTVKGHRQTTTMALAAVVDTIGRVTVVEMTPGHSKAVLGPLASKSARRGNGLNLMHVGVTVGSKGLQLRITVNGSKPILFTGAIPGLKPATGIAAVGKGAILTAIEYRLFR